MATNYLEDSDHALNPQNNLEEEQKKVVRICVLGATGVGKSTLCNFLCNREEFKTQNGPISCTKQSSSFRFEYDIDDNKKITFEVTDTPGWFDCNDGSSMSRIPSAATMIQKINECIQISKHGVTAYLIVVPYDRLSIDVEHSIYFMRDCFDSRQLDHVWMIFTKCKKIKNIQTVLETFQSQKNDGERAATLLYNYCQTINEQCYVSECEYGEQTELESLRKTMLTEMSDLYDRYGSAPGSVFQTIQREYRREITKYDERMKKIMLCCASGIGIGTIFAIKGYMKYQSLFSHSVKLQNEYKSAVSAKDQLQNEYNLAVSDNNKLQNEYNSVVSDNITYQIAIVAEVGVGLLGLAFEPISYIAIADGFRRLFGVDSPGHQPPSGDH